MDEWVWSNGGMILTGENWSAGRITCSSTISSATNPTRNELGTNPCPLGNWLHINYLSHGTASKIILNGEFLYYVSMYQLTILHIFGQNVMVWLSAFIHSIVCLNTLPQPPPKPARHAAPASAPSFNFRYSVVSITSSSSCLRLLPRLPVTPILPSIFPSITCFRMQFLHKMWPIQLALLIDISIQKRKETSVFYPNPLLRRREGKPGESLKKIRGSADIYIFLLRNACLPAFCCAEITLWAMWKRGRNGTLTLILLTWRIWWVPNNCSRWHMGFIRRLKG